MIDHCCASVGKYFSGRWIAKSVFFAALRKAQNVIFLSNRVFFRIAGKNAALRALSGSNVILFDGHKNIAFVNSMAKVIEYLFCFDQLRKL